MMHRWLPGLSMHRRLHGLLLIPIAIAVLAASASATEVWSGRTFGFAKPPFGNPSLAANQDRITPQVWITRGNNHGIYNIKQESAYTRDYSPKDTEWATGDAVNHASLTFQPWELWNAQFPPGMVGVNACVHLISEDIYIDIIFDSWASGSSGGAFAYRRGLPPVVPTAPTSWGRVKQLYR